MRLLASKTEIIQYNRSPSKQVTLITVKLSLQCYFANIPVSDTDISLKPRFSGSFFNQFYTMRPKYAEFGEITQNKGHYNVQSHSRLPSLVPIESSYATSN